MKKIIIAGVAIVAILSSCGEVENKVDSQEAKEAKEVTAISVDYDKVNEESMVSWTGAHIGGLRPHNGTVNVSEGVVSIADGKVVAGKFNIDMATITVLDIEKGSEKNKDLVDHLLNPDFFNVKSFTEATFIITEVKGIEGDYNSNVTGNLTILGIERSISFDAKLDIADNEVALNSTTFTIDRTEWGVDFHKEGAEGLAAEKMISNDITLTISVTIAK